MEDLPKQKTLYKVPEIRQAMDSARSHIFGTPEVQMETAMDFFGLGEAVLTEEELRDFSIFVDYASKRLVNTQVVEHLGHLKNYKQRALKKIGKLKSNMGSIAFHDISHCIVTVARGEAGNSVVPAFLKEGTQPNNIKVIQEEAFALMWENVFGRYPLFIYFLKPELKQELIDAYNKRFSGMTRVNEEVEDFLEKVSDSLTDIDYASFDSVFKAYQTLAYLTVKKVNQRGFNKHATKDEYDAMNHAYDEISADLIRHPDEKLVSLARSVFENYDSNPKILFQEFMKICGPLIERLKKRKTKG